MIRARIFVFAVLISTTTAFAIPQQINYQGFLAATDGSPLDTTVAIAFQIWSAPSGGSFPDWTETHAAVLVADGIFNVQLGSVTPLIDLFSNNRWLGITVGDNTEMTPRQQIVSVAHAYRVATVNGASGGSMNGDVEVHGRLIVGDLNSATGEFASITGGEQNEAVGQRSIVGGGSQNDAIGQASVVGGGFANNAPGNYSVIDGGYQNTASGLASVVGGGRQNRARGSYATVGGGGGDLASDSNSAVGQYSTVSGGRRNRATFTYATVAGGDGNDASGEYSVISGGEDQTATAMYSTVGGGYDNHATGVAATVSGGYGNTAAGDFSLAAGQNSSALGNHSIVLGTNASCSADSAFVWSDGSGPLFSIGAGNTFNVKANGGYRFWTTANHADDIGARLPANSSAWTTLCDSTRKHRYGRVDAQEILNKVCQLPIETWSYRVDPQSYRHVGPMAQDFWNAFHLGDDSLSISTIDPAGVALAAIQELAKEVTRLQARVQTLEAEKKQALTVDNRKEGHP